MNKYIDSDIEQGLKYFKAAIMNALADIESGEETKISLKGPCLRIVIDCAEERGWKENPDMDWDWTNGWSVDFWYQMITPDNKHIDICGSLLEGSKIKIQVNNDND